MIVSGVLDGGAPVEIRLSDHAAERYRERVKPHLSDEAAMHELGALVGVCPVREGPPAWLRGGQRPLFHLDAGTITLAIDPDPRDSSRLLARTTLTTGMSPRRRRQLERQAHHGP